MRLLIIGGSDAGIAAALRAKEIAPASEVAVLLADRFPNYSICGLPFFVSGETPDWRDLAHRRTFGHLEILTGHTAVTVDPLDHGVTARRPDGATATFRYDKLILATGAAPRRPDFLASEAPGVFSLHTMQDAFDLRDAVGQRQARSAIVVGGGYIGMEMADALSRLGLSVCVLARTASVLPTVDSAFGHIIERELAANGVDVRTHVDVVGLESDDRRITAVDQSGHRMSADLALLATGVRPSTELARAAGVALGVADAIRVSRRMETDRADIFAAGDCVETWHRILDRSVYLPLGTTAHKQGRIAGENAVGGDREFAGSVGTQVVKLFDLAIGRTGLLEHEARAYGGDPWTTETQVSDHKAYYPGVGP